MEGRIKWLSYEKKYGFIQARDCIDRFFLFTDIVGGQIPCLNDIVSYNIIEGRRGFKAANVLILQTENEYHMHAIAAERHEQKLLDQEIKKNTTNTSKVNYWYS